MLRGLTVILFLFLQFHKGERTGKNNMSDTVHMQTHFHPSSANSLPKRPSPVPPPRRHARQVRAVENP